MTGCEGATEEMDGAVVLHDDECDADLTDRLARVLTLARDPVGPDMFDVTVTDTLSRSILCL